MQRTLLHAFAHAALTHDVLTLCGCSWRGGRRTSGDQPQHCGPAVADDSQDPARAAVCTQGRCTDAALRGSGRRRPALCQVREKA
eukprot:354084-Chlamydomonas_euryale.AAC.2